MTMASITGVDTHAHVFHRRLPMVAKRRYTPDYDATVEQYLTHLDHQGLSHGVLVQPSFLGTDNDYMLKAIAQHPDRLKGVAVVDPSISAAELDRLKSLGVVGCRLNLVGLTLDDYAQTHWQQFFKAMAARDLSLEIHRAMVNFDAFLPAMLDSGVVVVVDHFGLPEGGLNLEQAGHRCFLDALSSGQLWVKLSAPYRAQLSPDQAVAMLAQMREACGGLHRFVWGSDWPHTRFETEVHYGQQWARLEALLPESHERHQVLVDNPDELFQFT